MTRLLALIKLIYIFVGIILILCVAVAMTSPR